MVEATSSPSGGYGTGKAGSTASLRTMADDSHALRKMSKRQTAETLAPEIRRIRQRLVQRPVFSLSDALNKAEMMREEVGYYNNPASNGSKVLGLEVSEDRFSEDCEVTGCACKR